MPDLIKPFRLSCMQNMQTIGGKTYLYPTVFFGFSLLDPDSLLTEANYFEVATAALPAGGFLDMGYPKRMAEVLIAGEARAPAGTMVRAREVSVVVGDVAKRALVFGDRFWVKDDNGVKLSEPQPFEAMPLTAERAFGNEKHPLNPVGRGCDPDVIIDQFGYAALPNIENPARLIALPKDKPEPVLFGPLSHEHPLRKSKLGTPSHEWIKTTFPDPPPGFDRAYFNVAPADQRLPDALNGDERVIVTGMSADNPAISTRLPALRVRLFAVHDRQASRMTEIPAALETVWIFGSAEIGGLYYRGAITVADKQASDVVALVVAAERLAQEPRPAEYYAEIYRLRTDPSEGAMHSLNDLQLMPPLSQAEAEALQARSDAYSEEVAQKIEKQFAWEIDRIIKESGMPDMLLPEIKMPHVPRLPFAAPEDIASGKADLAGMMRNIRAATGAIEAQSEAQRAAYFAGQRAQGVPIPPDMGPVLKAAVATKAPDAKGLFSQAAKAGGLKDDVSAKGRALVADAVAKTASPAPPLEEFAPGTEEHLFSQVDAILAKIPAGAGAGDEEELFRIARARALALPEADPFYEMKQQLKEAAEAAKADTDPKKKGEKISPDQALGDPQFAAQPPADFKAMDGELKAFAPESVDHIDKLIAGLLPKSAGKDLPPTLAVAEAHGSVPKPKSEVKSIDDILKLVEDASGTNEASFFSELDEDGRAFFAESDHERSHMPEAAYPLENYTPGVRRRLGDLVLDHLDQGMSFARRDIAGADLSEADLSDLDLSGVLMERSNLNSARLRRSVFKGAALAEADFSKANATGSDFSRAGISKLTAVGGRFDEARFSERIALSLNLEGASFRKARFDHMTFQDGNLRAADFDGAEFLTCIFLNCDFSGARFNNARFEKCMFLDCTGARSDWSGARFDRQLISKFKAPDSRWTGASFLKSTFVGNSELRRSFFDAIGGQLSSFLEADLGESCFMRADIPEFLFLKCNLSNVDFRVARARRAVFSESSLSDSDFFASDLMEAQLGFCDARRASFRGANLFSANLSEMTVAGADLSHANLGQTILEMPS